MQISEVGTEVPQIKMSYDYSAFSTPQGNRELNSSNLSRIERSMNEKVIMTPLIVNEKMQIIDGQHRFHVLKKMTRPIFYIVIPGLGIDDVKLVNTAGKGWNEMDHLKNCASLGNKEYTKILSFMERHNELPSTGIKWLLARSTKLGKDFNYNWLNGGFVASNWDGADDDALAIKRFKDRFSKYKSQAFIKALLTIIWEYDHDFERILDVVYRNSGDIVMANKDLNIRQKITVFYNKGLGKQNKRYFWKQDELSKQG